LVIAVARAIYFAESLITFESVRARSYPAWYMKTRKKAYLPAILLVTLRFTDVAPLIGVQLVRGALLQLYHWYLKLGVGLPTHVPLFPYTSVPTWLMRGAMVGRAGANTVMRTVA
jgi:hypothetical protein